VVGLDTLVHVLGTMQATTCERRPVASALQGARVAAALVAKGALGQKTKCGIYRKQGKQIQVLDLATCRTTATRRRDRPEVRGHPG
jgi:3-hydroxyacyl-CoA dehydrogenase